MTAYALPTAWGISRMEMRVMPNLSSFANPLQPASQQVVDRFGDYWVASLDFVPIVGLINAGAAEAFIDRLAGNTLTFYDRKRPHPLGTLRDGLTSTWSWASGTSTWSWASGTSTWTYGNPVVKTSIPQFAITATINTVPGRTLYAGDKLKIGGRLRRIMADATADGSGDMAIEFRPAAESAIAAYSAVEWDRPTLTCRLAGDVPIVWTPSHQDGFVEGFSLNLIEAL